MKIKKGTLLQIIIIIFTAIVTVIYYLYINDNISFKLLSIGDMNPYGGWSALKSNFTDLSYRFRGFSKSMALTISIFFTALFMGRFFCGNICPIGAMQDFFKYIGKKLKIKEIKLPKSRFFNLEWLKYFILILVMVLSIIKLGNVVSPFSPWLGYLNIFMGFSLQFSTIILIIVILLSLFVKRVFCRCFCPLGAFQSLLYVVGPFKVYKTESCNNCSHCLKNCPMDIQTEDLIISPECISCSECMNSRCIKGNEGYSYKLFNKKIKNYTFKSILLLLSIYLIIPLISSSKEAMTMNKINNLQNGVYFGSGTGFGGKMEVEVFIDLNKIKDIKIISHEETSGYHQEVFKEISKKIKETQNLNPDVISGATASSRGFVNAVKDAVSKSLIN